jgi:hypothetical protein
VNDFETLGIPQLIKAAGRPGHDALEQLVAVFVGQLDLKSRVKGPLLIQECCALAFQTVETRAYLVDGGIALAVECLHPIPLGREVLESRAQVVEAHQELIALS